MKHTIWIVVTLFLFLYEVAAQDTSRQQVQTSLQRRARIHQEEHLLFQDGKLYRMQQGVRTQVQEAARLKNGGVVNPDGSYQLKDQQRQQLRNGECIDLNGNRYQSQRMFNQRRMMTPQQMNKRGG
jgi:hypothetical protein